MPAVSKDITIEKGSRWVGVVTCRDSKNVIRNLTGYKARMKIRSSYDAVGALLSVTSIGDSPAITIEDGVITITLISSVTAALTAGSGVYDIELYTDEDNVERLVKGEVIIDPEATY